MRLRVLSLNVWGLPPPVGSHVDERVALVARGLPSLALDVALFQEVWTERSRQQLRAAGPAAGLAHAWWPAGPADSTGGLLALSRHPIRDPRFRRYRLCGLPQRFTQMDYYSGKGVARFDLSLDGVRVAVLDTHLHARYAPVDEQDDYLGHRTAEVIEIADELAGIDHPAIVAGDLNMLDSSPEYRLLRDMTGLVDSAAALGERQPTSTLQNAYRRARGAESESRIDYVMSRSGSEMGVHAASVGRVFHGPVRVAGEAGAYSDHAGLLAELRIGGPGAPARIVDDDAFTRARKLLEVGRERARRRQRGERASAAAAVAATGAGLLAMRRPALTRRRFLRLGLGASTALAAGAGGGLLLLSERFVPRELAAYDEIDALLERVRRKAAGGPEPRESALSLR